MSTFVWYSQGSKESGEALAKLLNCQGGTVPPRGFSGAAICIGASYTDKFKWGDRNFRGILNDPRKTKQFTPRNTLFAALSKAGLQTPSVVALAGAGGSYTATCGMLVATEAEGFVMCKPSGAKARRVRNDAQYLAAQQDGCTLAVARKFLTNDRVRLFVVDGKVVGALQRSVQNKNNFLDNAVAELGFGAGVKEALAKALDAGVIAANKSYWAPMIINSPRKIEAAEAAAKALGFGFCAVDLASGGGAPVVLNVVTNPALVGYDAVQEEVAKSLTEWTKKNNKSAKQILLEMAQEADEEVAEALLDELRQMKNKNVAG